MSVEITAPMHDRFEEILTDDALAFLARLHREFEPRRRELLEARTRRFEELSDGGTLHFLDETKDVREGDWQVAEPAPGLVDRRAEITGPTDAKMTINALNSGAKVWLADHEDANTPLWENMVNGQLNLRDAVAGTLELTTPEGKQYSLKPTRPRRSSCGRAAGTSPRSTCSSTASACRAASSTSALYFFHCAQAQIDRGSGPYFYLPKMESHLEARLWNDAFVLAQDHARHPAGHHPRHRADRDLPRGVRDGGDPLRAARPLGRAQRRPLGLHVQRDQELPRPGHASSCCPTATR